MQLVVGKTKATITQIRKASVKIEPSNVSRIRKVSFNK